jgi:hypothetical protein
VLVGIEVINLNMSTETLNKFDLHFEHPTRDVIHQIFLMNFAWKQAILRHTVVTIY